MSAALKRIEETREALVDALEQRDWEAIGQLDMACRACVAVRPAPVSSTDHRASRWSLSAE